MENNNNPIRTAAGLLGGSLAKFRITKITKIAKDGRKEVKKVNFEVDDVEAFRKKMKGRKFADVQLVYENIF
jgi:hypothetical protein